MSQGVTCLSCAKGEWSLGASTVCDICQGARNPFAPASSAGYIQMPRQKEEEEEEDDAIDFTGGECVPCTGNLKGLNCDRDGETLASVRLRQGFWRSGALSMSTFRCPSVKFCPGGNIHGPSNLGATTDNSTQSQRNACADLHDGPYCQVNIWCFG